MPQTVAMDAQEMELACKFSHGSAWRAHLLTEKLGRYAWRCYLPNAILFAEYQNVYVERYCWAYYGLHARGGSTAYDIFCGV
jgi:hypothetical protein